MANNLRLLRIARGLTQDEAAEALGTGRGQYYKLERGIRRLSTPWIDKAAKAFGVDAAEIVGGDRHPAVKTPPVAGCVTARAFVIWSADEPPVGSQELALQTTDRIGASLANGLIVFKHSRRPFRDCETGPSLLGLVDQQIVVGRIIGSANGVLRHVSTPTGEVMLDQSIAWASPILRVWFG